MMMHLGRGDDEDHEKELETGSELWITKSSIKPARVWSKWPDVDVWRRNINGLRTYTWTENISHYSRCSCCVIVMKDV